MKAHWVFLLSAVFLALPHKAQGEIFKCVSPQGHVSFAATPCPLNIGQTSVQRPGPPLAMPDTPREHVQEVTQRAIKNLQVSSKARVRVIEGENYKKLQVSRLPAPTVASQCVSPNYNSECFDPSAGRSSVLEALRQSASSNQALPRGLPGTVGQR